jgi:hypothetical protein
MIHAGTPPTDAELGRVLGAALAVAADADVAEEATLRVFAAAAHADIRRLTATAVRLALRAAPATPFAAMALGDAEAVAVTKYSGLDEAGAAALLDVSTPELRRRLVRGLTAAGSRPSTTARGAGAPRASRRPQLPRGYGAAACPAGGGHAS